MFNSSFPTTTYTFYPNGINGPSADVREVVDMMRRVRFLDNFGSVRNYKSYTVKTGETPEVVSTKLYGSPDWYWLIMLFNDLTDPFRDWPRSGFDQTIPAVTEDTVHYLPGGTGSFETLNPYDVGDQIVRVTDSGDYDEDNPFSSVITRIRPNFFGIDLNIPASSGVRLKVGDKFGVNNNGSIEHVNTVTRLENPITTVEKFEDRSGGEVPPFAWRSDFSVLLDPTAEGAPSSALRTTLIYEWIEGTEAFQEFSRSVTYQFEDRSDSLRTIKVFPDNLKNEALSLMTSLISQKPSGGRTSVIRSANQSNLSLL